MNYHSDAGDGKVTTSSSPRDASPPGEVIRFMEFLHFLVKNLKLLVAVPFTVAVITALGSLLLPNIYTAKALIVPGDEGSGGLMNAMMAQVGGLAAVAGGVGGGTTKAELYVTMLKSEAIKDPIIDRFNLMELYKAKYRARAYTILDGSSNITAGKKDGVITVAFSSKDPKLAAAVANAYVEELGKLAARLSMTDAGVNRAFLEERLAKAAADLRSAEDALKSFQTRNKTVAVTDQTKATLDGLAQLRAQLVAQEVQLSALRQQYSPQSNEVKSTQATIATLRGKIDRMEGDGSVGSMPGVGAMPQLGQEYARLMREFKVQEALVELLTKQYEMNKLNESKDVAPFQVLQQAKVPELKSKPKRSVIVLLATVTSALLMLLILFVREWSPGMSEADRERWQEIQKMLPRLLRRGR